VRPWHRTNKILFGRFGDIFVKGIFKSQKGKSGTAQNITHVSCNLHGLSEL